MSHFTVAVITKGKPSIEDIENKLAPYQENNMDDCPKEYLKFYDYEEYREDYETKETEAYKLADGKIKKYPDEKEKEGAEIITISFRKLYDTFEQYLDEYQGAPYDEEMQKYGYWFNPNAKWDWWQIGGRWAGLLRLPIEVTHEDLMNGKELDYAIGEKSFLLENDPYKSDKYIKADIARIKDIIIKPDEERVNYYRLFWELKIEDRPAVNEKEIEIKNEAMWYKKEYYLDKYKTKENFIEMSTTFSTWAFIDKEGKWHEPGEMGYFAISNASPEDEEHYIKNYKSMVFDNADDDDYLTIVDCHI